MQRNLAVLPMVLEPDHVFCGDGAAIVATKEGDEPQQDALIFGDGALGCSDRGSLSFPSLNDAGQPGISGAFGQYWEAGRVRVRAVVTFGTLGKQCGPQPLRFPDRHQEPVAAVLVNDQAMLGKNLVRLRAKVAPQIRDVGVFA